MSTKTDSVRHFDQALRAELRAQRKALRAFISQTMANRAAAVAKARHLCAGSKERAKLRAKAIREAAAVEARKVQQQAKTTCELNREKAKRVGHAELADAESKRRRAAADERNVLRSKRKKVDSKPRRTERLDEVRADIPAHLLPVFEQVKRTLQATPRKSLTEVFLDWAESNPEEVAVMMQGTEPDTMLADAMREQRSVERALRSRKQLRATDWKVLGTSPAELESVGLDPNDPDDVIAFLAGYAQQWRDMATAAVPF